MADRVTPKFLDITLHDRVPSGQWEIVDVVFPATPGTDLQIAHSLRPATAEQIEYTVLRQATPGTVYEDRGSTRLTWNPGFIVLRSDTGGWTGRLLLQVLKVPQLWAPGQNISSTVVTYPLALSRGGTGASLSATGGAGQVLKQKTAGAVIAVETLAAAELGTGTPSSANFLRGDLAWSSALPDLPFAMVYKASNQTGFTAGTYGLLSWDTELADTWGMHDNSTNNSRLTVPTSYGGRWLFVLFSSMTDVVAGGGGQASSMLRLNAGGSYTGGTLLARTGNYGPTGAVYGTHTNTVIVSLSAGDYVEAFAVTTQAAGSLTYEAASWFRAHKLS